MRGVTRAARRGPAEPPRRPRDAPSEAGQRGDPGEGGDRARTGDDHAIGAKPARAPSQARDARLPPRAPDAKGNRRGDTDGADPDPCPLRARRRPLRPPRRTTGAHAPRHRGVHSPGKGDNLTESRADQRSGQPGRAIPCGGERAVGRQLCETPREATGDRARRIIVCELAPHPGLTRAEQQALVGLREREPAGLLQRVETELGPPGRMISASKSGYRRHHPDRLVTWNGNPRLTAPRSRLPGHL